MLLSAEWDTELKSSVSRKKASGNRDVAALLLKAIDAANWAGRSWSECGEP